jgi:hypothetical protein
LTAHTYACVRATSIAAEAAPGTTGRRAALLTAVALDCTPRFDLADMPRMRSRSQAPGASRAADLAADLAAYRARRRKGGDGP